MPYTHEGAPGAHFTATRMEDGRYKATTRSWPELEVIADKQNDALARASKEFREAVLLGKVGPR